MPGLIQMQSKICVVGEKSISLGLPLYDGKKCVVDEKSISLGLSLYDSKTCVVDEKSSSMRLSLYDKIDDLFSRKRCNENKGNILTSTRFLFQV